jgi:hypothetical protein
VLLQPAPGATGVPINTRIWFVNPPGTEPPTVVTGPTGQVHARIGRLNAGLPTAGSVYVLTPTEPLAPNSDYTFANPRGQVAGNFRTGAASDDVAPGKPVETKRESLADWSLGGTCGDSWQVVRSSVTWEGPFLVARLAAAEPASAPDLLANPPSGDTPYLFVSSAAEVSFGASRCTWWPSGFSDGRLWYGAMDIAGNFSGWSDAGPIALPALPPRPDGGAPDAPAPDAPAGPPARQPSDGCRYAGGGGEAPAPAAAAALTTLALALAWRWRRRPRRDRP